MASRGNLWTGRVSWHTSPGAWIRSCFYATNTLPPIHRWLNEGIIAGEQLTPGAPWRIRLTEDLRALVAEEAPEGYLTVYQTMRLLRVSRQTVWQRVKRGEIKAIHVRQGRKKACASR